MHRASLLTKTIIAFQKASTRRYAYTFVFIFVFLTTFSLLLAADLVPNAVSLSPSETPSLVKATTATVPEENAKTEEVSRLLEASPLVEPASVRPLLSADVSDAGVLNRLKGEYPVQIEIKALGLTAPVDNPTSTDVESLDEALLSSAVRYPTSAKLGTSGNVVLFAHSSYLPVVHNKAFKMFNGIQNLSIGDEITVYSENRAYIYAVEEVGEADASSDAIPLSVAGQKLTLSTCDSFGAKTARFIVVATLVETRPI